MQTYPNAATLELIQNKGVQKDFYTQHNIPTSAHMRFETLALLQQAVKTEKLDFPFVWKAAKMGYDGNGVKIIRESEDLDYLTDQECMVEDLIPFTHDLR